MTHLGMAVVSCVVEVWKNASLETSSDSSDYVSSDEDVWQGKLRQNLPAALTPTPFPGEEISSA